MNEFKSIIRNESKSLDDRYNAFYGASELLSEFVDKQGF